MWECDVSEGSDFIYITLVDNDFFDGSTIQCAYYQPKALRVDIFVITNIEFGEMFTVHQEWNHALDANHASTICIENDAFEGPGSLQMFEQERHLIGRESNIC